MVVHRQPLMLRAGEVLSYSLGMALLIFFAVQIARGEVQRHAAVESFHEQAVQVASLSSADEYANPEAGAASANAPALFRDTGAPDTSLWAPGRIADYQNSLTAELPPILGVLEVPSVSLEVPVYQEDSALVMDRAAGVINGMAYPHEGGNIGISGHRDGYFRALKDVKVGDRIVLQTLQGEKHFTIDATTVVDKTDTTLLKDTPEQTVTLVTCYPFYFVGHAPQRFIVTASLDTTDVNHTRRN